jgi:tetratricopeptide (TPR) repeat protein
MSVIYNVSIKPAKEQNRFHITWDNKETQATNSFYRESEITLEEIQRLWQWPRCQISIGEKLFRFLDGDNRHFQKALDRANQLGEPLQIHLYSCKQIEDWPFELLAHDNTFLLPQGLHLLRTVSEWCKEKLIHPEDRPLKLLFMACSALDVKPELDFEREEEAIFRITENLPIDMEVEDSGSLEGLRARLEKEHYDVVHLSGHANIDKNGRPYFVMEDETGYQHNIFPDELWNKALIENPPRLLLLSGCRTGEAPDSSDTADSPENTAEGSFARLLVEKYNVPAVLGWGRSVSDKEASHAGKMIFHELSRGRSILEAVQRARFELIKNFTTTEKPAWPLLRLYSSGVPLNAIAKEKQQWKPKHRRMKHVHLKNSQVQVLAEGFVGRRRQLQTSLRALKQDNDKVGLILLGTGGLGKSCLAEKICERFPDHTLIIVHGRFNTITLENALTDAFIASQDEKGQQILSQKIEMTDKLSHLCTTSFKEKNYLFLLDDFEQNIEGAETGKPASLIPETAILLEILLRHLPSCGKKTQLLITSRYAFPLSIQGQDLIEERLEKVWLTSFRETEQQKKLLELPHIFNYEDKTKIPGLLASGHGNPRLMEWLDVLVGQMDKVKVTQLLEAMKEKQEDFIRVHVIRELLVQGGKELELFLRWFSIYRRPVLEEGVEAVAEKAGIPLWRALLRKGMSLSLAEHDRMRHSYQVTPLLREELLRELDQHLPCHEAAFAYYKKVCEAKDPLDPLLTEEWIFHALGCGEEEVASDQGGRLVTHLREGLAFLESRRVGEWVLAEKNAKNRELSTGNDASLLNDLAYTIHSLGDHRKAIEYYQLALDIDEAVFGQKHPDVARELNNLGSAWKALGDHRKAIEYYRLALDIDEAVFGQKHLNVAGKLNNLGSAWNELGDHRKAIEYYQLALDIWKEVLGETHPEVASALNNLGSAWDDLGDHRRAIEYYQQALDILKEVYGETHPHVATALNNLGLALQALGDHRKAIDLYQQALNIDEAVYGQKHHNVAQVLNNLGLAWDDLGDHRKAIDLYRRALNIDEAVYGREHPEVAIRLNNLGLAWNALGESRKAIDYYQQALNIWKKVYGEPHPHAATALNNLGLALQTLGVPRKAIKYYQQALDIDEAVFGQKHPNVARELNNLGSVWMALGNHRKAIEYYQQALDIDEVVFGQKHPNVARELNNLGSAYYTLGDHRKAIKYFENALDINEVVFGKKHPNVARKLNNLGLAWEALGEFEKAKDYFEQALVIEREIYGEDSVEVIEILNKLGHIYLNIGEKEKAKTYLKKVYKHCHRVLGPGHPDTKHAYESLKAC